MGELGLPPRVREIANGSVTWERITGVEYDFIGYFLSCHLVIEHYMQEYLKIAYPALDWNAASLTFPKTISLLSRFVTGKYDCVPALKHMNSLRNKVAHDLRFKIQADNLQPLAQYLTKTYGDVAHVPTEPKAILSNFTSMVCAYFGGSISGWADKSKC
jgi:hypothetical protein